VLFAVPYETDFTLLGTTDVEVNDEPGTEKIDDDEIDYICRNASEYFKQSISAKDVVWTYSGVRPLYNDASENASKVTRDYKLDLDTRKGAPVLSVYGGKITTFRKLAEQAVDMLKSHLTIDAGPWTATAPLPGGDIADANFDQYLRVTTSEFPWLEANVLQDYVRNYGTRIHALLGEAQSMADLGQHFAGPLYQAEVDYLVQHEWAQSADDILWRRTKKGLHVEAEVAAQLQQYLDASYTFTAESVLPKVS